MALSDYIHTFGQHLLKQHGERIHKIALDAGFTCPNRTDQRASAAARSVITVHSTRRTAIPLSRGAIRQRAARHHETDAGEEVPCLFQAYTNTYADVAELMRCIAKP